MGGDGDALDALVLCSSLPAGTVIEVIPIAVFKFLDNGETDYKILAISKDNTLRTIQAKTLENLNTKYPKIKEIVALWFLNYNSKDTAQNLGWGNEEEALLEVKKAIKNKSLSYFLSLFGIEKNETVFAKAVLLYRYRFSQVTWLIYIFIKHYCNMI